MPYLNLKPSACYFPEALLSRWTHYQTTIKIDAWVWQQFGASVELRIRLTQISCRPTGLWQSWAEENVFTTDGTYWSLEENWVHAQLCPRTSGFVIFSMAPWLRWSWVWHWIGVPLDWPCPFHRGEYSAHEWSYLISNSLKIHSNRPLYCPLEAPDPQELGLASALHWLALLWRLI